MSREKKEFCGLDFFFIENVLVRYYGQNKLKFRDDVLETVGNSILFLRTLNLLDLVKYLRTLDLVGSLCTD